MKYYNIIFCEKDAYVSIVLAGAWLESIVFHTLGGNSTVLPLTEGHQSLHTLQHVHAYMCESTVTKCTQPCI